MKVWKRTANKGRGNSNDPLGLHVLVYLISIYIYIYIYIYQLILQYSHVSSFGNRGASKTIPFRSFVWISRCGASIFSRHPWPVFTADGMNHWNSEETSFDESEYLNNAVFVLE